MHNLVHRARPLKQSVTTNGGHFFIHPQHLRFLHWHGIRFILRHMKNVKPLNPDIDGAANTLYSVDPRGGRKQWVFDLLLLAFVTALTVILSLLTWHH
jgi:hypothetical protein